jgi:hypothetical protein
METHMPRYRVDYCYIQWRSFEIQAASREDAVVTLANDVDLTALPGDETDYECPVTAYVEDAMVLTT